MNLQVFALGGIILIAAGVLQVFLRPRRSESGRPASPVDGAVVRAVVFVVFGVLAMLVGLGVLPLVTF